MSSKNTALIIGLTGPNASGKGEAAQYLKKKGYKYHSLSDIIREEAAKLRMKPSRENLIYLGNRLRELFGPSILAKCVSHGLNGGREIVDSIRNPAEIEALRKLPGFLLLGIDAPVRVRFERLMKRNRAGDARDMKDFLAKERKENLLDRTNQQISRCLKKADKIILNDGSLKEFHEKIDAAISKRHRARN
jgi:dephospho-CoA kinase